MASRDVAKTQTLPDSILILIVAIYTYLTIVRSTNL